MFIVTKTIDSENISRVCRTCLREDNDKMLCLFVGPSESSLGAKLKSLSCLEVAQGDGLPEKMCDRCVMRAESALLFREQCRAADKALRQAAVHIAKANTQSNEPACEVNQQNQSYAPLQYSQNTSSFIDYRSYTNHQELYMPNRLHPPLYQYQENIPQHMSIVESHNPYLNLSHYSTAPMNHEILTPSAFRTDNVYPLIGHDSTYNSVSNSLQCLLCNYTFNSMTQLVNHNTIHNSNNVAIPNEEVHVDVEENLNNIERNLSYEKLFNQSVGYSIEDVSYNKLNSNYSNGFQNLNFANGITENNYERINVINSTMISQGNGIAENNYERINVINSTVIPQGNNIAENNCERINVINSTVIPQENCIVENNHESINIISSTIIPQGNGIAENNSETIDIISSTVIHQGTGVLSQAESSEIKNKFKCDICSRLFSQKSKLTTHQLTHSRRKPFKCDHCGKTYSSKSKLAAHKKLHTRTNVYQCHICDKIFSYPSYLSDHMKSHSTKPVDRKPSFECAQCKKQFYFSKSYKRHMRFHTGKGLFHCDICNKLFSQKYSLKVHMRSHECLKSHKCDLCDKSFNQKSNLVEHMRTHTKIKPFQCNICDKSFAQSSHLKSHEVSHNAVRRFQCRICGKDFKLASHLKRHMNLHTGLKAFKCEQCDQTFTQAFSLKRHTKKHFESDS